MHSPKVSVIIPVDKTAPYLHEALSSITSQTLMNLVSVDNRALILDFSIN